MRLRLHVSLTALNTFLHNDFKRYWPYVWYVKEAKTHSCQDLEKKRGMELYFLCKGAFSPTKWHNFALFCLNGFGFINFESQESEFPIVLNMFVNMFYIAEGFGHIGCRFNIGPSTIFVGYLALVWTKHWKKHAL